MEVWRTSTEPTDPGDEAARNATDERYNRDAHLADEPALRYHGVRVAAITWHPERPVLAVSAHTEVRIFDVEAPINLVIQSGINCLRWHPTEDFLAAGSMTGDLVVVDPAHPADRQTYFMRSEGIRGLAFSPNGQHLLSITENGPLLRWPVSPAGERSPGSVFLDKPDAYPAPVSLPGGVAWSPDGTWAAVGGHREIALLDTDSWQVQARFEVEDLVNAVAIDPAGRIAVATSGSILTVRSPAAKPCTASTGTSAASAWLPGPATDIYSRVATTAKSSAGTWAMIDRH